MKVSDNATVNLKWQIFLGEFWEFLRAKRGRKSRFASYLGVPRQRVNDWTDGNAKDLPGWVVANYYEWQRQEAMGYDCGQVVRISRKIHPEQSLRKCVR